MLFVITFLGRGPGAGYGSADGSGAGYGGRGGRGVSTQQTGSPYGDFKTPRQFGSGGGGAGAMGGAGGGSLQLNIANSLVVEGNPCNMKIILSKKWSAIEAENYNFGWWEVGWGRYFSCGELLELAVSTLRDNSKWCYEFNTGY